MLCRLALVSLLASLALAGPARRSMVVHESRTEVPAGFVNNGPAPDTQMLTLRLALKQGNISGLEQRLLEISDPNHQDYGQWLSKDDAETFVQPSSDTVAAVNSWLSENGLTSSSLTPQGDWISVQLPVSRANALLNTQFSTYTHTASGQKSVRTLQYSLPAELQPHVDVVHPTVSFTKPMRGTTQFHEIERPDLSARATAGTAASSCNTSVTPSCLQELYGIPSAMVTKTTSMLGVTGMGNQFASDSDLTTFLKAYRPDMPSVMNFTLTSVDGGSNYQTIGQAGVEADIDIQYTIGVASGIPTYFISVGTTYHDGDDQGFLDIITALLKESAPPQSFTTSYGFNVESDLSKSLTTTMCNSYMQLAARGVSIMFASGDGGVAASPGEPCTKIFNPTFPTCPYVTLVGATSYVPEQAADFSAGGFSNYFAQPSWQSSAVASYISKMGNEYSGMYNKSGRAFPDVSAQGLNIEMYLNGQLGAAAGTSCSSPIFASVIALLNAELIAAGKPVLGFLNPWLYANPQAFNDITVGSNPGCNTDGFSALPGWDPVTGLGTPNFAAMRTAAGLS